MSTNVGLRHLRAVVAVADAGSFTAAAAALQVAQSSLSRTVMEAERRLGVPLFKRTTRKVNPTPDGAELVLAARRLLDEFETTLAHFEGYLDGVRGSVSIAALPSIAATLLPPVLAAFRRPRPEVAVSVRDGHSDEVLSTVRSGAVDMALTVAATLPPELVARPVAVDRFACVMPVDHPLTRQHEVRWRDLAGEAFVRFDSTTSIRQYTDRVLAELDLALGPSTEARNIGAVAGLSAAGLGLTAAPGLVLPMMRFAHLTWRPLVDPVVSRHISLVQHRERRLSRTALELRELLMHAPDHAGSEQVELPDLVHWRRGEHPDQDRG